MLVVILCVVFGKGTCQTYCVFQWICICFSKMCVLPIGHKPDRWILLLLLLLIVVIMMMLMILIIMLLMIVSISGGDDDDDDDNHPSSSALGLAGRESCSA